MEQGAKRFKYRIKPQQSSNNQSVQFSNNSKENMKPNQSLEAGTAAQTAEKPQLSIRNTERFLSGTPETLLKWFPIIKTPCLYEVIATIVNILTGKHADERIFVLRGNYGPVLKVSYFSNDNIHLPNFNFGLWVRCVGRMQDQNTLRAFSIRDANPAEVAALPRMSSLCAMEVSVINSGHV